MSFGPHHSNGQKRRRGQPLLVLAVLLLGWSGMRFVLWSEPYVLPITQVEFAQGEVVAGSGEPDLVEPDLVVVAAASDAPNASARVQDGNSFADAPLVLAPPMPLPERLQITAPQVIEPQAIERAPIEPRSIEPAPQPIPAAPAEPIPARVIIGHNLMLAAGLSQVELPPLLHAYFDQSARGDKTQLAQAARLVPPVAPAPALGPIASQSRWSADAWLLLRRDTTTPVLSGRPSYGRSQAGAVLRYRLAPNSSQKPQAYIRASSAIEGAKDNEISAGISARPLAKIPLRVAAELRASKTISGSKIRPAVFAVSEFPPLDLPMGVRAEAYLQAGYVGGSNATGFADGQLRLAKPLAKIGPAEFEAGGGIWGGAQKDGERLDIGPSASVTFDLGKARSRLAVDYRFRVAGEAEPSSGPALTLSAGF